MLLDLTSLLRPGERTLRLRTNRTVFFDQALVAETIAVLEPAPSTESESVRVRLAPLVRADLRRLGYPRRVLPDGKPPEVPDYSCIEPEADWGNHQGLLTRLGDVRELAARVDDRLAILGHGDEVALGFNATALPDLPAGWKRTFLLLVVGYEKALDLYSAFSRTVEPLPFAAMGEYPYPAGAYPLDAAHARYLGDWNTRPSRPGR
jgi:hypothetical protein